MGRLVPALITIVALLTLAVIFGVFSSGGSESRDASIIDDFRVNEQVKAVTVTDREGQAVVLDSSLPDRTLITFWDATCGECHVGLQTLQAFVSANPVFKPIYINVKNQREQADEAMKRYSLTQTYYDPTGAAFTAWSGTMPATYLVQNGTFIVFFPGRPSSEHLNALLTLE